MFSTGKIAADVKFVKCYLCKLRARAFFNFSIDLYNADNRIVFCSVFIDKIVRVAGALRYQQWGGRGAGL